MYGFNVSRLMSIAQGDIYWSGFFPIINNAKCGDFYYVDLFIRYGTSSAPAPSVTDHLVVIQEGQALHCNAQLNGTYWLEHPVSCTVKDSFGNVVFTHTKWLVAGIGQETEFFRNVDLPVGAYTVDWSVCGTQGSHYLTVQSAPPEYTTNDIDITIVVTHTTGIDAYDVWDAIKDGVLAEMLIYNTTVELKSAEIDGMYLVVFHLEVTAPPDEGIGNIGVAPIAWMIFLALIAVIAYELVAVPAIEQRKIAQINYNTTFYKFTYENCANLVWAEWTACMAAIYPAVWADIKDKIEQPTPPPPSPDWMTYIMYIILGVGTLAGVFILVKYVMPALKGR